MRLPKTSISFSIVEKCQISRWTKEKNKAKNDTILTKIMTFFNHFTFFQEVFVDVRLIKLKETTTQSKTNLP